MECWEFLVDGLILNMLFLESKRSFDLPFNHNLINKGNNKLPNSEQSYKGKVKTHNYINRQNQSTTGKLWKP